MTTLQAHFDGRVLVPDGPVDLPKDRPLEIEVREVPRGPATASAPFPPFPVTAGAKTILSEDVRRAMEDEY